MSDASPTATAESLLQTSVPTSTPTPVAADAAIITASAERFIHSWNKKTPWGPLSKAKAPILLARSFSLRGQNQRDAFEDFMESGGDVNGTVDDTRGPIADITMNYGLSSNAGGSLRAIIHGTLHYVHGSGGWLIDNAHFVGRTFTAFRAPNGEIANILDSKITGPEAIQFHIGNTKYEWSRTSSGWKVAVLDAPTPVPQEEPVAQEAPTAQPAPPMYREAPAAAQAPEAGCEAVDMTGVYADGEILELDDGRRLKIAAGDEATSAVWVAPVEALICGDKLIDKDDNETVDLAY